MNWLVGPIRRNESEYDILKDGEHMYGLVVGLVSILLWGEIQGNTGRPIRYAVHP